ncbi:MAG: hypothetical protein H0V31_01560, partial [Acidobacteria bacterium]|nr:hypothetical protein [Acidobacteriota bacterium]
MVDSISKEDSYPLRDAAISALATQKDMRAVPALRLVLPEVENWQRGNVVRALLASNGFTVSEQIEALEVVAKNINLSEVRTITSADMSSNIRMESDIVMDAPPLPIMANTNVMRKDYMNMPRSYNPSDITHMLGNYLVSASEVSDALVAALVERITELDTKEPQLAFALRRIIQGWQGAGVNRLMLRDLKNGKADINAIVKLLSLRKELREKQSNEVYDLRSGGNSTALGIAACLLENNNEYDAILAGNNAESKTAMLGCARLIRARLPIRKVAENLSSPNKLLALAAERYLESEDSPEAQALVFALYPNEAKILGATVAFTPGDAPAIISNFLGELFASVNDSFAFSPDYLIYEGYGKFKETEKKLQTEVKENHELLGIYAYDGNFIRIYKNKAIFSWEEDEARYNERTLTEAEFNNIKGYLASQRINELAPFLSYCEGCESKELLTLGRQGGRRIFMRTERPPNFFAELNRMFAEMRKPSAKLRYWLEKDIAGLEILFTDKNLQARTLWKNGSDFRVLLDDTERRKQIDKELQRQDEADQQSDGEDYEKAEGISQKRRAQREFENSAWYQVGKDKLEGLVAQPPQIEYLPVRDGSPVTATNKQWKARTPNFEIRTDNEGLYKKSRGQITRILSGFYDQPVVTPNGRWAIAAKYSEEDEGIIPVRVNLLTNKEFKIKLKDHPRFEAVAFVPAIDKVLVFAGIYDYEYGEESGKRGDYFLLDAETGNMQAAKGEIRPLAQQTFRPLQLTANADEFWAAIP